jgi:hypothetical protein
MDRGAAAAIRNLRRHQAPTKLIEYFKELHFTNKSLGSSASVSELLIDACRRFNFSAPFAVDEKRRHFRARLLESNDPEHADDCLKYSNDEPSLAREQAYRRGFDQGFAEARQMLEKAHTLEDIKARETKIHAWRTRPLQIVGSSPGSDENYKACLLITRVALSPRTRFKVFKRDDFRCQICGKSQAAGVTLHVDHRISIANGGSDELENLQTLCCECNLGKSSDSMKYYSISEAPRG